MVKDKLHMVGNQRVKINTQVRAETVMLHEMGQTEQCVGLNQLWHDSFPCSQMLCQLSQKPASKLEIYNSKWN